MKKITLNVEGITPKQWTNFVLELNIMRKAWKPYGVNVKLLGHGVQKIIKWGTKRPIRNDLRIFSLRIMVCSPSLGYSE